MSGFNLRQIEMFRAVMQTGSVSRAAEQLNVSQPAVSRLLSYTEQRLGLALFERIKGRLHPTPEARRIFAEVESVYQGVQRINAVAADLLEHRAGQLRIACSPSLAQGLLPRAVAAFRRRAPDARLALLVLPPHELAQALLTQQAELGLVYLDEPHPQLHSRRLYANRLVAALPADHPLTARNRVSLEDLARTNLIDYGAEVPIGRAVRRAFAEAGLAVAAARPVEVRQVHVACALVQWGVGTALIDEITATGPVWTRIVFRPLRTAIETPVHLLHGAFEPLSLLARTFIETLEALKFQRRA